MKIALTLFWLSIAGVAIAAINGWVSNLIKLFGLFDSGFSAELLIRLVGVPLAVIGVIAGYF